MDLIKRISTPEIFPEVKIVEFDIFSDSRGLIWTSFLTEIEEKILPKGYIFKHDKFNISRKRVLRGIHGDNKTWKFVSCPLGNIEQVIVDLRKESKNFKKYVKRSTKTYQNSKESCLL